MTDRMFELYLKSTRNAIRAYVPVSTHRVPHWMHAVLSKLYHAVPARAPYSVLALWGLAWERVPMMDIERLQMAIILQKGWDLETSALLYKNFRFLHPVMEYNPHVLLTFNREQLKDQFGATYGDVIADLCSDPGSQPFFSAMLFGRLDVPVTPAFCLAQMAVFINTKLITSTSFETGWPSHIQPVIEGCSRNEIASGALTLDYHEVAYRYEKATGAPFCLPDLHPRELDYDKAAIRAALRQADCPVDPFDEQPHQGQVQVQVRS